MHFKNMVIALAALGLVGTGLAATPAMAQEHRDGDRRGGEHAGENDHRERDHRQWDHRGGEGYRNYRGGRHPEWGGVLGYYGGYPWYCRQHRHWRWSVRRQAYVYSIRSGYC